MGNQKFNGRYKFDFQGNNFSKLLVGYIFRNARIWNLAFGKLHMEDWRWKNILVIVVEIIFSHFRAYFRAVVIGKLLNLVLNESNEVTKEIEKMKSE